MKRIIPSLLFKNERLVKGVNFTSYRDAGRPETTARTLTAQGADEILFIDLDASLLSAEPNYKIISSICRNSLIPLTVGGGINNLDIAKKCIDSGADKVCLTTTALDSPKLITEVAEQFGCQAVMIGVDLLKSDDKYRLFDHRDRSTTADFNWQWWLNEAVSLGAGEIKLTSVGSEGSRNGLDLLLHEIARQLINVPIILEGGAGGLQHILQAFESKVEAVALGSMLVYSDNNIIKIKSYLKNNGIKVRL